VDPPREEPATTIDESFQDNASRKGSDTKKRRRRPTDMV